MIGGFTGLQRFPSHVARPLPQTNLSDGSHAISPDDLATSYNISPLYASGIDGTGQTIAIAGVVNLNLADIRTFRKTFGLPANDPTVVLVGRDPGPNPDALVEADLDVEWSGAIARNANVVYVYASDPFNAARYAIDQNLAPVLSLSFGECEAFGTLSYRAVAQQANAQGITFLVASGDLGAALCDHGSPVPQAAKGARANFPSGIPEVTSVGGTMFNEGASRYWGSNGANNASALSYIPEVAWNETSVRNQFAAGGGGPSAFYAKPFWQAGPGVPDDKVRDTPDISLTSAFDHDPYLVVSGGSLLGVGGTSAAAPSSGRRRRPAQSVAAFAEGDYPGRIGQYQSDTLPAGAIGQGRLPRHHSRRHLSSLPPGQSGLHQRKSGLRGRAGIRHGHGPWLRGRGASGCGVEQRRRQHHHRHR